MSPQITVPSNLDLFLDRRAELPSDAARVEFDRVLVTRLLQLVDHRSAVAAIGSAVVQVERDHRPLALDVDPEPLLAASESYPEPVFDPLRRRRGLIDLVLAPVRRWLP